MDPVVYPYYGQFFYEIAVPKIIMLILASHYLQLKKWRIILVSLLEKKSMSVVDK